MPVGNLRKNYVVRPVIPAFRLKVEIDMSTEIPVDLVPFVQRMVSEKRFLNESDVLAEGLRLLQAKETLRAEVKKGFAQLDAGLGIAAADVCQRAEERIQEIENGKV